MDTKQHIYYVLGRLAYSVARADDKIRKEDKKKLHDIIIEEIRKHSIDFGYSEIISNILKKDKKDFETTYNWAIHSMKLDSKHFTSEMKQQFIDVIKKVTETFPPVIIKPGKVVERFIKDMESI